MTAAILRKELHTYIDTIPDRRLAALRPLLADLATDDNDYWKPVIEPASPEECARAKERVREYHENPSSFVPLEDIL
jgi:hypothetical protein